ncbi:unnamed protein product [Phytophthora lilii]|uniref:Unnamed protein product n=1 Tax=Phytophthora lilii TaxID=2077276 RepID=A0A9W6TS88_9STRA|nr:unnamed protein product [Phytophthora lilii]
MKVLGVLLGVRAPVIPITIDGRLTILDLCDPIQENAGGRLDGIIASLLRMYAPRREDIALLPTGELDFEIQIGGLPAQAVSLFQNARPLASTEKIQDVLESVVDGGPVCMLAYVPFWQLRQHMGIDDTLIGNLEPYQSVANRLKDSPEVECLEAKLVENAATSYDLVREGRMPFVMLQSSSEQSRNSISLDMVVLAAYVLASRDGGFGGLRFASFMGVLLYELGVVSERDGMQLPSEFVNTSDVVIPFLSPPNDRFDIRVGSGFLSAEFNCEFDLLELGEVIERIPFPDESSVHLIVTETTTGSVSTSAASMYGGRFNVCCYGISKGSGLSRLTTWHREGSDHAISKVVRDEKFMIVVKVEARCA